MSEMIWSRETYYWNGIINCIYFKCLYAHYIHRFEKPYTKLEDNYLKLFKGARFFYNCRYYELPHSQYIKSPTNNNQIKPPKIYIEFLQSNQWLLYV